MEIHHHPDLHHHKKKWKEYLLEFVMIFLAVTLGFFAESLREHLSDKEHSRQYARSMVEDFSADTLTLHQLIDYSIQKILNIDSLEGALHAPRNRANDSLVYLRVVFLISTFQFDNINGAYQQILHAGSLRFFDQPLVNNLNSFDATAVKLRLMEDWENKFLYEKLNPQAQTMVNYKVFDDLRMHKAISHQMYFRNFDDDAIDILVNQAALIKRLRERQLLQQQVLLDRANKILAQLRESIQG